jgi:hypothetical protein
MKHEAGSGRQKQKNSTANKNFSCVLEKQNALSALSWVNIAALKKWLHKSLVINDATAPFFLVLTQYCRLERSMLFLAHGSHRRLGDRTCRWQLLHLAYLTV